MIRRHGEDDREVTHDDLLAYYQEHAAEYELPAKGAVEHLMARFSRFPSKREAWIAVGEMGNMVLRGAKLETVAREHSHGPPRPRAGSTSGRPKAAWCQWFWMRPSLACRSAS